MLDHHRVAAARPLRSASTAVCISQHLQSSVVSCTDSSGFPLRYNLKFRCNFLDMCDDAMDPVYTLFENALAILAFVTLHHISFSSLVTRDSFFRRTCLVARTLPRMPLLPLLRRVMSI